MSTVGHTQQLALGFDVEASDAFHAAFDAACKRDGVRRPAYHVRAHQTVGEVLAGEARAKAQDARVVALLSKRPKAHFTPWDVAEALGLPITSARRSLTNGTRAGLLRHHPGERRVSGPYRAKSGTWSIA